jgi:hypothetical protein
MREHRTCIRVSGTREVVVVLPSDFPSGDAEVIVRTMEPGQHVPQRKLTVDELLSKKLVPPPGVGTVTVADMDRAIARGACGMDGTEDSDDRAEIEAAIEKGYADFETGDYEDARAYAERLLAKT